jgi:hypothetical protein
LIDKNNKKNCMAKGSKNDNSSSDKDNEGGEEPDPIWKS